MRNRNQPKLGLAKLAAAALLTLGVSGAALAQPAGGGNPPGGGGGGGGQGGRGNFDPAQFRQMMMDRLKQATGASDDEWKVLEPKVDAVMTAQREARAGGMGGGRGGPGGGGPGGGGGGGGAQGGDQSPAAVAAQDLRTTMENQQATPEEIKAKMAALRDAREKAKAKLAAAQKDLKDLLTQRQEAALLMAGLIE